MYLISVRFFAVLICVHCFASGAVTNRIIRSADNDPECEEFNKPDWTIENLKNTPLDTWPWKCLNSRYQNASFHEVVSSVSADIFDAASKGYLGFVQYYVEKEKADLSKPIDKSFRTPLIVAIGRGHLHVVKYIAPKLMKLEHPSLFARDALSFAALYGNLEAMRYFLDEMKLDKIVKDDNDILLWAARGGNLPMLKYLIEDRRYALNKQHMSWMPSLAEGGNVDMFAYLVHEKNLTKIDPDNLAIHTAAAKGNLKLVQFLIDNLNYEFDKPNSMNETATFEAALVGSLPVLKYLIDEKGATLNVKTVHGDTLLHAAALCDGRLDFLQRISIDKEPKNWWKSANYVRARAEIITSDKQIRYEEEAYTKQERPTRRPDESEFLDVMRYLVDDKQMITRIDETNELQQTAASKAAFCGQLPVLKFLVDERHANTTLVDWQGRNLLHVAIIGNQLPTVRYLVEERGFDVHARTSAGETAHDLASEYAADPADRSQMLEYVQKKMNETLVKE